MAVNQEPTWTLTARWILPVEAPPLERGTVTVGSERILAVEPHGARTADLDLGNVAVLPGFVNAHTHLDLSGARGKVPAGGAFTDWLRAVLRYRRSLTVDQRTANVRAGLTESLARGTTLLGDVSGQGQSWLVLSEAPLRAVVFYELLGLTRVGAHQAWSAACDWLRSHAATPTCRPGLSPHAPYSVRASLFRAAANHAHGRRLPLTIHLAETRDELQLLQDRAGPFVAFLSELGVWDPQGLVESPASLLGLATAAAPVLLAHGNYLDPAVGVPASATVVYCPRTHAAFGHAPHPFRALLAAGVRVALGTDSLASNPDLDLLAEARWLHGRYPDVPPAVLLRLATLSGAEALGWQEETGSLSPGKSADLVVLPLPAAERDPAQLLLESSAPVQAVLCRGQWVWGFGRLARISPEGEARGEGRLEDGAEPGAELPARVPE